MAGGAQAATTYRVLTFGPIIGGRLAVQLGPVSEAALQLLEQNGLANYSDSRAMGASVAVADANSTTDFADRTLDEAVDAARDTASADPIVQARLACPIDCNLDRTVTVAELITAVNRALGHSAEGACEAADGNGDGAVSIDELVEGVQSSIGECFTGATVVSPAQP
jgi:alanyl-tRNA synthetase